MDKAYLKNLLLLGASIVLVLLFVLCFSYFYQKTRIKPAFEIQDYKVEVQIVNKDGFIYKPDSCQYIIKPKPTLAENPIEANDYSSFLVSFVSVLATFVVIANFANAKDLISSSENAEKAKDQAETAKKDVNEAKGSVETISLEVKTKIKEVEQILADVKSLKSEVENVKSKADESLTKSTETISSFRISIEEKFNDLASQITDAKTSFANTQAEIDNKQGELLNLYDEVVRQAKQFEEVMQKQRADLNATISRLVEMENKVSSLDGGNQIHNNMEIQEQVDSTETNQNLPANIDINNNQKA